jgi:hypothetical protein
MSKQPAAELEADSVLKLDVIRYPLVGLLLI